jgi:hypothetical protein
MTGKGVHMWRKRKGISVAVTRKGIPGSEKVADTQWWDSLLWSEASLLKSAIVKILSAGF